MEQHIKEFEFLSELIDDLEREGIKGITKRRHIENFLMRKSRLYGRPYCASFELTPLCNFDCKMCYMHLSSEQAFHEGRILTENEWLNIAKQTVEAGVANIDLTGGECLTHPVFKNLYQYLINAGVNVSVLTNGQLIDDDLIAMFTRQKPAVVQISLYGSSPEAYVKVTGRNAFDDVINSIHRLKAAGIRLQITITPHRYMQDDAAAMLNLVHSLEVDYSIGSCTLPSRPGTGRNIEDYIIDNRAFIEICKLETEYRKKLANSLSLSYAEPYNYRIKGQELFKGAPCSAGASHFHINWKGEMQPCISYYAVTKSVFDNGLEAAWTWIRDTMKQFHTPSECADCDLQSFCSGCAAERTSCILNGKVNPLFCKRQRETLIPNSIITRSNECIQ